MKSSLSLTLILILACIFYMTFKLITLAIDMLIITVNSAWLLSFWWNSPLLEDASLKQVRKYAQNNDCLSKTCRSLKTGLRSAGVKDREQRDLEILCSSLDPCLHPDVYSCQSPLAPPILSSLDIKEDWILDSLKINLRKPRRPPSSQLGTISINKPFLSPNSDFLNIDLLKCHAHELLDWQHEQYTVRRLWLWIKKKPLSRTGTC